MVNPKDLPLIISSLQLLALKEILRSPSFKPGDTGELDWLLSCIDKTVTVDAVSHLLYGGIGEQLRNSKERYGKAD